MLTAINLASLEIFARCLKFQLTKKSILLVVQMATCKASNSLLWGSICSLKYDDANVLISSLLIGR